MKTTSDSTEGDGEISPEALRALNELLAEGLPEDASEEEAEACMKKFASMPGGEQMLRALNRQLQEGGGELLNSIMGQEVGDLAEQEASSITSVPDLYCQPRSFLRLVFRFQKGASGESCWRRVSLPSDASFYDLHLALQDSFFLSSNEPHRFEWRVGARVEATFLSGDAEVEQGDDYCEFQNRPLDFFTESVTKFCYCLGSATAAKQQEFAVEIEKLIDSNQAKESKNQSAFLPECLDGREGDVGFEPTAVVFRKPGP